MTSIRHTLTIDLEEQFQLRSSGRGVPERHWERFPARIGRNLDAAMHVLDRHDAKATFFVNRWIANRYGSLLGDIAKEGHEIASSLDPRLRVDVSSRASYAAASQNLISLIEGASGQVVHGCRIAQRADRLGRSDFGPEPDMFRYSYLHGPFTASDAVLPAAAGGHTRVLTPSLRLAGQDLALRSGFGLRFLPDLLARQYIAAWGREGTPRIFDFKIWELDPNPTELSILSPLERGLCYRNLARFEERLSDLLDQGSFAPLRDRLGLAMEPIVRPAAAVTATSAPCVANVLPGPAAHPISIVVPCYNEEAGLAYLANTLDSLVAGLGRRHGLNFVLVDDGSTDGTWSELNRLFGSDARFRLIRHKHNRGIGAAILTGIAAAATETVAVIDSDCSYDPARIEEMLPLLTSDVALVTASPYHDQGRVEGVPEWRLVLSRGASRLYRIVLHNKLATYTSCFRIFRKSATEGLVLRHEGFIGVAEMLARLDLGGWRIAEHPAVLETRLIGRSKLRIIRVVAGHLHLLAELTVARLSERFFPATVIATRRRG